jgi:hypothetical protein
VILLRKQITPDKSRILWVTQDCPSLVDSMMFLLMLTEGLPENAEEVVSFCLEERTLPWAWL